MIGIYGGSFDPPHQGHVSIIKTFWKQFPDANCLKIIPNYLSPLKKQKETTVDHILKMMNIVLDEIGEKRNILYTGEILNHQISYTVDTIDRFKEKYTGNSLYLLIGMDNLIDFPKWKEYLRILESTKLLVFQRPGFEKRIPNELKEYSEKIEFLNNDVINISSSQIRNRDKERERYLSKGLINYMKENHLYGY